MKLSSEFLSLIQDKGRVAASVTVRIIAILLVITTLRIVIIILLGLSRIVRIVIVVSMGILPESLVDWIPYFLGRWKTAEKGGSRGS